MNENKTQLKTGQIVAMTDHFFIMSDGGYMVPSLIQVSDMTLSQAKQTAEELHDAFEMDAVRVQMAGYLFPIVYTFDGAEWTEE